MCCAVTVLRGYLTIVTILKGCDIRVGISGWGRY